MRIDQLLAQKFNFSRTKAQQLIESGFIFVDKKQIKKVSYEVDFDCEIKINDTFKYASLGGDKLAKALLDFNFSIKDKICLDVGASNGGFTDCMLQNGAKKVYALDVGECAFSDELKNNPKVIIKDRLNARFVTSEEIGELVDFISIDVSFISLKLILENMKNLLKQNSNIIALIKPQFEAGKKNLTKKGIVKSQKIVDKIILDIKDFAISLGYSVLNLTNAPFRENKNKEYLILLAN